MPKRGRSGRFALAGLEGTLNLNGAITVDRVDIALCGMASGQRGNGGYFNSARRDLFGMDVARLRFTAAIFQMPCLRDIRCRGHCQWERASSLAPAGR